MDEVLALALVALRVAHELDPDRCKSCGEVLWEVDGILFDDSIFGALTPESSEADIRRAREDDGLMRYCLRHYDGRDHVRGFFDETKAKRAMALVVAASTGVVAAPGALEALTRLERDGWNGTDLDLLRTSLELG